MEEGLNESENEEVIEEYDSDSDLDLLLSEDVEEDEDSDVVVPSTLTLTTRTGRQIRAVVRLDLQDLFA